VPEIEALLFPTLFDDCKFQFRLVHVVISVWPWCIFHQTGATIFILSRYLHVQKFNMVATTILDFQGKWTGHIPPQVWCLSTVSNLVLTIPEIDALLFLMFVWWCHMNSLLVLLLLCRVAVFLPNLVQISNKKFIILRNSRWPQSAIFWNHPWRPNHRAAPVKMLAPST